MWIWPSSFKNPTKKPLSTLWNDKDTTQQYETLKPTSEMSISNDDSSNFTNISDLVIEWRTKKKVSSKTTWITQHTLPIPNNRFVYPSRKIPLQRQHRRLKSSSHPSRKGLINVWFLVNRVPPRSCHRVNILTRGSPPQPIWRTGLSQTLWRRRRLENSQESLRRIKQIPGRGKIVLQIQLQASCAPTRQIASSCWL